MNEFEENDKILYYSFPFVFLLGRGFKTKGSMPISTSRHFKLKFTSTAASTCRLMHLIMDQHQRHANTRKLSAYLKQNQTSFDEFARWQNEPIFLKELQDAARNPRAAKSKKMCQKVMKHVNVISQKIPFPTSARK